MNSTLRVLLLTYIAVWFLGSNISADEFQQVDPQIGQLIEQLDADRSAIRDRAHREILAIGVKALSALEVAANSSSAEQRTRVRQLIHQIRFNTLRKRFRQVAQGDDNDIDMDAGMVLIATILETNVDIQSILGKLDQIADDVRKRLGRDVEPRDAAPKKVVDALISVLRDDVKLTGNVQDYDNPQNSSIKHVLATRRGLPIILSHLAVSVAGRLDVPIVGIAVPQRYMIKYDGARAGQGHPRDDIIIDPFGNWQILTPAEVKKMIPSFDAEIHTIASPRRESLTRMLRNLASDLMRAGDAEKTNDTVRIIALLEQMPK